MLYARAFWGLMVRDISVLRREFIAFMIRTVMNPPDVRFRVYLPLPQDGTRFSERARDKLRNLDSAGIGGSCNFCSGNHGSRIAALFRNRFDP